MAIFDAAEFIEAMSKLADNEELKRHFIGQVSSSALTIKVSSNLEKIYRDAVLTVNPGGDPLHPFPKPKPTPIPKAK